ARPVPDGVWRASLGDVQAVRRLPVGGDRAHELAAADTVRVAVGERARPGDERRAVPGHAVDAEDREPPDPVRVGHVDAPVLDRERALEQGVVPGALAPAPRRDLVDLHVTRPERGAPRRREPRPHGDDRPGHGAPSRTAPVTALPPHGTERTDPRLAGLATTAIVTDLRRAVARALVVRGTGVR